LAGGIHLPTRRVYTRRNFSQGEASFISPTDTIGCKRGVASAGVQRRITQGMIGVRQQIAEQNLAARFGD
jgi:hypothetical protein